MDEESRRKIILGACADALRTTLGRMPSEDADKIVGSVIQILVAL